MTYAQATGAPAYSGSSGGAVVLRPPSGGNVPQVAEVQQSTPPAEPSGITEATPAPVEPTEPPQPTETQTTELPKSTPTQSQGAAPATEGSAAATSGGETPPAQPDTMPTNVPSPVGPGDTVANVSQPPAPPASDTTTQSTEATTNTQPVEPANPTTNTEATEPAPATPPVEPSTDQQAAVAPAAPATEGGAAAPNAGGALPAGASRILYTGDSDEVPAAANAELDKVAATMTADQNTRVQILAYAAGTEETESKARRKSLARGLAIRSYLIKAGVASTRIDVRALGSKADGGPADRVDIVPAS
jgi:outer membrane protein OmpA-like peptidoglycan-associated protein